VGNYSIGIIGGSGVYDINSIKVIDELMVDTPFGSPSDKIVHGEISGFKFYFLPRHGKKHSFLPSEVNYRANIFALKKLGVNVLLSISAVGSLTDECQPATFFLPDQFIDWTKGKRERTFFGNGIIGHVSTANPVEINLKNRIFDECNKLKIPVKKDGAYICIEGPQFSSRAESNIYRGFGAKVIGMTNVPESYLAKEAGMAYSTVAMVTDFDCWKEVHCNVDEIMKVMKTNNIMAQNLIGSLIPSLYKNKIEFKPENAIGVMTPEQSLNQTQRNFLKVLLS